LLELHLQPNRTFGRGPAAIDSLVRGRLVMAGSLQNHSTHDDRVYHPGAPALPEPGL